MTIEQRVQPQLSKEEFQSALLSSANPVEYLRLSSLPMPRHVVIIPDGNGRFAQRHGFSSASEGHREGAETIISLLRSFSHLPAIEVVTMWALSPDNLKKRPPEEVNGIFHLVDSLTRKLLPELQDSQTRLVHLGDKEGLPSFLVETFGYAEESTRNNAKKTVALAVNYGGEQERLRVINHAIANVRTPIDQDVLQKLEDPYLLGPVDLIIRTGAEDGYGLSGLGLDGPGTQLVFSETLFPEFDEHHLALALSEYPYKAKRLGGRL